MCGACHLTVYGHPEEPIIIHKMFTIRTGGNEPKRLVKQESFSSVWHIPHGVRLADNILQSFIWPLWLVLVIHPPKVFHEVMSQVVCSDNSSRQLASKRPPLGIIVICDDTCVRVHEMVFMIHSRVLYDNQCYRGYAEDGWYWSATWVVSMHCEIFGLPVSVFLRTGISG